MKVMLKMLCLLLAVFALSPLSAYADAENADKGAVEATAAAKTTAATPDRVDGTATTEKPVVEASLEGEQIVKVNTGSETVDDAANLVARCAEKKVALEACGGGFKGIACRKGLEMTRFKGLTCPSL